MSFSSVIDLNLPSGCSHGAKISFVDSLDNSWHVAGSSGSNANEIVAHRIFHKHRGKLTNLPTITPVGHLSVLFNYRETQKEAA